MGKINTGFPDSQTHLLQLLLLRAAWFLGDCRWSGHTSQYIALTLLARSTVQEGYNNNLPHQVIIIRIKLKINIGKAQAQYLGPHWELARHCLWDKQDSNTEMLLVCTSWVSCLNSSVEVSLVPHFDLRQTWIPSSKSLLTHSPVPLCSFVWICIASG